MNGIKKAESVIGNVEDYVSMIAFILMIIDVMAIVLTRYVFHVTFTIGEEIARYLMIWCAYSGAAYGFRHFSHVGVVVFAEHFPKKLQPALLKIRHFLTLAALICLFIFSFMQLEKYISKGQLTTATRIPMWVAYIIIPISMLLSIIHVVLIIVGEFNPQFKEILNKGVND